MIWHKDIRLWIIGPGDSGKIKFADILKNRMESVGVSSIILNMKEFVQIDGTKDTGGYSDGTINYLENIIDRLLNNLKNKNLAFIILSEKLFHTGRKLYLIEKNGLTEIYVELYQIKNEQADQSKNIREVTLESPIVDKSNSFALSQEFNTDSAIIACEKIFSYLENSGFIEDVSDYMDIFYKPKFIERIYSWFPVATLMMLKAKMKVSIKGATLAAIDDILQFFKLRKYDYRHDVLFIAGLPKSGTTWMLKMLDMIPGYHQRPIIDPSRSILFGNITPLTFQLLPKFTNTIIKLHTKYTPYNFRTLCDNVEKFVVIYRDLRDMCISRYFHVLSLKSHRHYELYRMLSQEESIFHCINMVKLVPLDWVRDWHAIALKYPDKILEVRYEELNKHTSKTMKKVLSFFDLQYDELLVQKMVSTKLKKPVSLEKSLIKGDTKRKGIIGDWKNYFSEDHKDYLKSFGGDLLITLGYEKSMNW